MPSAICKTGTTNIVVLLERESNIHNLNYNRNMDKVFLVFSDWKNRHDLDDHKKVAKVFKNKKDAQDFVETEAQAAADDLGIDLDEASYNSDDWDYSKTDTSIEVWDCGDYDFGFAVWIEEFEVL